MVSSARKQLTRKSTCKRKHTYHSLAGANRARERRNNNKLKQFYFTAAYKCNVSNLYHLTTQEQEGTKHDSTEA